MGEDGLEFKHFRPGKSSLHFFFPQSSVEFFHIYQKDRVALMHLWQGEYHRSQFPNPTELQ